MRSVRAGYLLIAFMLLSGCGKRAATPPAERTPPAAPGPSLEFGESMVRFADSKGRWEFEAQSAHIQAATAEGPFVLTPANATYQEIGKEPVHMRAARADVDRRANEVVLQGAVEISSNGWLLEAERVSYHLETGKVVSPARTKLTFGRKQPEKPVRSGHGKGARG